LILKTGKNGMPNSIFSKNKLIPKLGDIEARFEAARCLACYDPPCQKSCPASIPIPDFIRSINTGNVRNAAKIIRRANPMAAICGVICPEEIFCQSHCTRNKIDEPIKIRELHDYATSFEITSQKPETRTKGRVAVIGSGPAGLACASKLAEAGIEVVIYEQSNHPGGVPAGSIPDFRLADKIINFDMQYINELGIEIELNSRIENPEKLLDKFDAVFVAAGLANNRQVNIPGEDLPEVITALRFLEDARSGQLNSIQSKRVIIIGGGNVSLDAAATAVHEGASEVRLLYRRGPKEMKVWRSELEEAQSREVIIDFLISPLEFTAKSGKLNAVKCIRMRLGDKIDSSGRRIPELVAGTECLIPADLVITAIGLTSDYMKSISVNDDRSTSVSGIFAGGDWARGEGTIVEAVRDGKLAAESIQTYLKDKQA